MTVTTDDVTTMLKFLIELSSGAFNIDDEGYLVHANGKRMIWPINAADGKPMVVYRQPMPRGDFHILNPFAEGLGNTPSSVFFYQMLRFALSARLRIVLLAAVKLVLIERKLAISEDAQGYPEFTPTDAYLDLLSGKTASDKLIVEEIDDKTFDEFNKFLSNEKFYDDVICIAANRRQMVTIVSSAVIENPVYFDTITGMRKKTFLVLQAMLKNLLKVKDKKDLLQLKAVAMDKAPVKLSSWLQALFNVYSRFNQLLGDLPEDWDDYVIDLGTFKMHLENLAEYTGNAKWMTVANAAPPTTTTQPNTTPSNTSQIPGTATGGIPTSRPTIPTGNMPMPQPFGHPPAFSGGFPQNQVPAGMVKIPGQIDRNGNRYPGEIVPSMSAGMMGGMGGGYPMQPQFGQGYPQGGWGGQPMPAPQMQALFGQGQPQFNQPYGYSSVPGAPFGLR